MGHVGLKTRSLRHVLEKPCVLSKGHIFSPILMKLGQNVCIDNISDEFETGLYRVKNQITWPNLRKPCVRPRDHNFGSILKKPSQNVCLYKISKKV